MKNNDINNTEENIVSSGSDNIDNAKPEKKKRSRKNRIIDSVLLVLIIAFLGSGIYLLVRPYIVKVNRQNISNELLDALDSDKKKVSYNPRANRLGEVEYDFFTYDENGKLIKVKGGEVPDPGTEAWMTPIGKLEIPKLGINVAIIEENTFESLFYAVGHWEDSPYPNEPGNSALFAHRRSTDNYDLRYCERLKAGDKIYVTCKGKRALYNIVENKIIDPEDLLDTLETEYRDSDIPYITIVTCDPDRRSSAEPYTHRRLITAKFSKFEDEPGASKNTSTPKN